MMLKNKGDRFFFALWVLLSLSLSLLPLYSLGYLAFLIGAAKKLRILKSFNSYFANSVLALFILISSIMVAGIFTSYLHIPNYAILNLLFALFFCGTILYFQPRESKEENTRQSIFTRSDIVGAVTGAIVPIVIVAIHFTTLGVNGALFRIINSDGWDNTSHLNLLQVTSENKNYFYSSTPMRLDGKELYNNYPQGWHLATSSIINGIAPNILNPHTFGLSATLITYLLVIFVWYFIACYTLLKLSWSLLPRTKNNILRGILFLIAMQFPILALFLASITSGFINYLALMPILLIVVMLSRQVLESDGKKYLWSYFTVVALFTASIGLTWVLPLPALVLLVLLVLSIVGIRRRDITYDKILVVIAIGIAALSFLLYALLLLKDIGVDQLFVGNGLPQHFPNQWTIAVCIALLSIYYAINRKFSDARITSILLSPFVILVLGVWLLSYLHSSDLGYYSSKTLGLLCVVIFVFVVAALVRLAETSFDAVSPNAFVKICMMIGSVGLLIVLSVQVIDLRLLQRNQYMLNTPEREYATQWIYTDNSLKNNEQLLLERDDILNAPSSAMLFNRVTVESAERFLSAASSSKTHDPNDGYTCLLYFYYDSNMAVLPSVNDIYKSLSTCLKKRSDEKLKTKIILPYSAKSTYDKLDTYGAKLIYYSS